MPLELGIDVESMSDNYDMLRERGFSEGDVEILPVYELIDCIDEWVREMRQPPGRVRSEKGVESAWDQVNKGPISARAGHAKSTSRRVGQMVASSR